MTTSVKTCSNFCINRRNKMSGIKWIEKSHQGKSSAGSFMSVSKTKQKHTRSVAIVITFYKDAMELLGWRVGDSVMAGFDDEGFVYVKRVSNDSGYSLSALNSPVPKKELIGRAASSHIRFPVPNDFDFEVSGLTKINKEDVIVDDKSGVVSFLYPGAKDYICTPISIAR